MNYARKLASALLALTMVIALAATAFAAGEPTTGSLTIVASESGTTYQFYRLLDLTLHDLDANESGYESYAYSLNTAWHDFWTGTGAGAAYLVDTNTGTLNSINVDGTIKYINIISNNIVEFTNAAMQYALDNSITADQTATGNGSNLKVNVDKLGYYLMIPVDASIKTEKSQGSVASLTSTDPDVTIEVKAKKPSIKKTDDVVSADIGKVVTYTITGVVPSTAGYSLYIYKISDKMSDGLTFKKDVSISIQGRNGEITNDTGVVIDYDTTPNGFTATIPVENYQDYIGNTITLTYTAVVNDKAVIHSNEKNEATLEYGHDPDDLTRNEKIQEELYSAKIIINKYTGNDEDAVGKKLSGAKFVLMNSQGKFYKYSPATDTTDAAVTWATVTGTPAADAGADVTDAQITALKAAVTAGTITAKTTDAQGAAEFSGIADGTYYLVEIEAPAGYNRLQKAAEVEVKGNDVDNGTQMENVAQAGQEVFDTANSATADIANNAGAVLPSTGGIGTTVFYFLGSMLVIGAIVLLITKKRLNSAE